MYFLGLGRLCPLILIPWVRSPFHFEAHVERVHVGEQPLGRLSLGVPASPTRYFLFKSSHFRPFLAISCYFRQFQDIIDFCNVNNISIIWLKWNSPRVTQNSFIAFQSLYVMLGESDFQIDNSGFFFSFVLQYLAFSTKVHSMVIWHILLIFNLT